MAFFNPDDILNKFGLPNYIQNGNFEMYSTFAAQVAGATKWNAYKDAAQATPVDGTGGTATVIRNASVGSGSQLRGTRSWQITKTGNAQGEGYSQDFTIDPADKSESINISFDFSAGSAYTTGDLAVYVYDITNATLITPASVNIPSGAGTFSTVFAATTSTSYRLIFHCAASNATTTNWSMTCDNIQVSRKDVTIGPAVTDWVSYTPTTQGFGTISSFGFFWRRVGNTLEVSGKFVVGTTTADEARVYFPTGLTSASTLTLELAGSYDRNTIAAHRCSVYREFNTSYFTFGRADGVSTSGFTKQQDIQIVSVGETLAFFASCPITGWSSNLQVADRALEEFASNSDATNADNTTSFAYGPEGSPVPVVATSGKTKRIRFQTPIQPTDVITLEFLDVISNKWIPYTAGRNGNYVYQNQNSVQYGCTFNPISGVETDVNVYFATYPRATGTTFGGAGPSWTTESSTISRWRVRKVAQGALVGADVPVYSQNNKVVSSAGTNWSGTVSQNGTSSVIERGSNANGEYIKFADGTMICTSSTINAPNQITVAFGSIFRTNDFDWTFPSSFLDSSSWNASGIERSGVGGCWVARSLAGGETASKASFVVYRPAATANTPGCRFIAIGRWY